MDDTLFFEKQQFTQRWIFLILEVLLLVLISLLAYSIFVNEYYAILTLILATVLVFIIYLGLKKTRLITIITDQEIKFKFSLLSFVWKDIMLDDIEKAYIRNFDALSEFGGFGIRLGSGGKAYIASGSVGLQLELKKGKKLLIGTQKQEELSRVIEKLKEEKLIKSN